jgi:cytochrome c553
MPSFMGSVPKVKPMKSLISLILSAIIFISLQVQAREAQTLYNQSCIACHASGAAGAPKKKVMQQLGLQGLLKALKPFLSILKKV